MQKESPIFVKTFDFMKWMMERTEKFPKSQRFFLAKRINDRLFDFYEALIDAAVFTDKNRNRKLAAADAILFKLKHYIRLSMEMQYITPKQYRFAAGSLAEIGRLLGGWLKKQRVS